MVETTNDQALTAALVVRALSRAAWTAFTILLAAVVFDFGHAIYVTDNTGTDMTLTWRLWLAALLVLGTALSLNRSAVELERRAGLAAPATGPAPALSTDATGA